MKKQKEKKFNPRILKWCRLRRKLSQKDLAKLINVATPTICNWERATYDCVQTEKLAEVFDIDAECFYMSDTEFAMNHLQMFPADFPNLMKLAIEAIYEQFDNGEYNDAIKNIAKIKDHITLATAMFSSESSDAQKRDLDVVANATKDDDDELIDDADPRK